MLRKLFSAFAVSPPVAPPEERLFDGVTKPSIILADMCIQRMMMHLDKIDPGYSFEYLSRRLTTTRDVEIKYRDPEKPLHVNFTIRTAESSPNRNARLLTFTIVMGDRHLEKAFSVEREELDRLLKPLMKLCALKQQHMAASVLNKSQQKAIDIIEALVGPKECETNSSSGDTPVLPASKLELIDTTFLASTPDRKSTTSRSRAKTIVS